MTFFNTKTKRMRAPIKTDNNDDVLYDNDLCYDSEDIVDFLADLPRLVSDHESSSSESDSDCDENILFMIGHYKQYGKLMRNKRQYNREHGFPNHADGVSNSEHTIYNNIEV